MNVAAAVQSLAFNTRVAYYRVLAAEQRLGMLRQYLEAADAGSEMAGRLRDAGNIKKLRKLNEDARREEAELAVLEARDINDNLRQQELESILAIVDEAISLHQTPEAYFVLGQVLEGLDQPREALRAYEWVAYWTQFYEYPFGGRVERIIPRLENEIEELEGA